MDKIDFVALENKVFSEKEGKILLGGLAITDQMRSLLRDQAKNLQTTNLYEIINATAINESVNLMAQSGNMEHLQYAKALKYWNTIFIKIISALAK